MSRCPGFGEWTSILRDGLPVREGYEAAAHLLRCDACRTALADARRLTAGLRGIVGHEPTQPRAHLVHDDWGALAAAIARREFPPEAWACEDCTELLAASIGSTSSDETRMRPRTSRTWARPVWLASALAAAGLVAAVLALGSPSQPWARAAGLRRGQLWLLPASLQADVERAVSSGQIAPPRFTLPDSLPEMERDSISAGPVPRALSPRWETVRDPRPEFRWSGTDVARAEVFLLDEQRRFLRSFQAGGQGRSEYPLGEPALTPGATYYWKVNLLGGVDIRPSAFVGFTVLAVDESRDCDRGLARASGSEFVEAVVAERCGLYSRAAAAFDRAAERALDREIAERLAREIRRRQGLDGNGGHD